MSATLGPGEGSGPGLVIGKICWRGAREQEFDHVGHIVARGEPERSRAIHFLFCGDVGAGIQQNVGEGQLLFSYFFCAAACNNVRIS
jgi:hypothetical protein